MGIITTNRIIKTGFVNFFRNIWLSVAATLIMMITLFIISTILILYTLTNLSINNIKDKVGVTAYFKTSVSEREILDIKKELELIPQVRDIEYIPKTVARDKFMETHKDEPLLLETLKEFSDEENPLPDSFALRAEELLDYPYISDILKSDRYEPFFDKVRDNSIVIDRLFKITDAIAKLGILLTLVFIIVTIMVMFNTIRLTIYNRREEVEIMRLVGASNWFIRGPFIVEGITYAILSTIVASLLIFALLFFLSDRVEQFLSLNNLGGNLVNGMFLQITLINLIASIILAIISSSIAIRRYLRI